ncbi:uncharacterized protein LOC134531217 isoform X2 [Bacillus rossius redtenbacheri]|uniref:uncharacterized protein LOC134531217 isoform X2 n=1 Tax=Bacillus rossius redtenbacheri TaxID=93214 RepID=UPI002FDD7937
MLIALNCVLSGRMLRRRKFVSTLYISVCEILVLCEFCMLNLHTSNFFFFKYLCLDEKLRTFFQNKSGKLTQIPEIEFFGAPFTIEKVSHLECSRGPKYYPSKQTVRSPDDPKPKRKRTLTMSTKKLECPAIMVVRCVRVYPEFSSTGSRWNKLEMARKLKVALKDKSSLISYLRFYIKASSAESHNHPITTKASGAESNKHSKTKSRRRQQKIHPELVTEIERLVEQGITATRDVKLIVDQYVQSKFHGGNIPKKPSKAFSPEESVVNAHVYSAIFSRKRDRIDQEALQQTINEWKIQNSDDLFFYRPYEDVSDGEVSTLLFCHQTKWQQKLLLRYGRVCLLDAAYKTMKYALPLFFLAVNTNVGYTVVGTFVVHSESTALISEALNVFKTQLPEWQPEFWMTDSSDMEISAVETTFPGSTVYLSAFHREQAWLRWVKERGNVTSDAEEILSMWRIIAASTDKNELDYNVGKMNASHIMQQNPNAAHYFATHWLPDVPRWVQAFIEKDFETIVRINNGIESQNKMLKHAVLCHNSDKSLTRMLKTVINSYLPDNYRNYCYKNSSFNIFNSDIPSYLLNRPQHFIKHILTRISAARSDFCEEFITEVSEGIFAVQSSTDKTKFYYVDFNDASCSCIDFVTFRFPCKHMCAIFEFLPSWSFLQLNSAYINSPYITLDSDHDYFTVTGVINPSATSSTFKNDWSDKTQPMCTMTEEHGLEVLTSQQTTTWDTCNLIEGQTVEVSTSEASPDCSILSAQQRFRNANKRLIDISYLFKDEQFLNEKTTLLFEMHKHMEEKIKKCTVLPLKNSVSPQTSQPALKKIKAKYRMLP